MTSRPLFMRVDESTVILGPMRQVGWASAASTPTPSSSRRPLPRNGPPDAVTRSRATPAAPWSRPKDAATRHWWMAQCSESTGTISAPGVRRARCTTGAPAMSDSLLASASRLPGSRAAIVTGRPAKPTTALRTTSPPRAASTMPSSPVSTPVPAGTPLRTVSATSGSPITTTSGSNSRACATSRSAERWAASACTRRRAGSVRTTSRAWVPMDPDEPIRLTERISSAEVEGLHHEVRGGHDEEQTVAAVGDPPGAGQDAAHVLDAEMPLDHGLAQVAERGHHRDDQPEHGCLAHRPGVDEVHDDERHQDGGDGTADETLPALVGADGRRQLVPAHGRTHQ